MSPSPLRSPMAVTFGLGVLAGALAVNVLPSPALIALAASLLTAAALAPLVAGAEDGDWAGRVMTRLCDAAARIWPGFAIDDARDTRKRVFAIFAGLNLAVFASFFLRTGA